MSIRGALARRAMGALVSALLLGLVLPAPAPSEASAVLPASSAAAPHIISEEEFGARALPPAVSQVLGEDLTAELQQLSPSALGTLDGQEEALRAGVSRPRYVWNPRWLAGDRQAPVLSASRSWIAVLTQDGEPVGWVEVSDGREGPAEIVNVSNDAAAATDIMELPLNLPLIDDPSTGGWFTMEGDQVRAVDAVAKNMLAGSLSASQYLTVMAGRSSMPVNEPTPAPEGASWWAPLAVGGVIILVLLATVIIVWVKRPEEEDEEEGSPGRAMIELRRPAIRRRGSARESR